MKDDLPEGWAQSTLGSLLEGGLFTDGDWVESKDQEPLGDVRLVQLADVGDGVFRDRSSRFLTSAKAAELSCTFLESGDVLIARMPDPLGRACLFPGDAKRCVTVVDVCIARPASSLLDSRWLMYAINAPEFRAQMEEFERGTTRKRISRGNLSLLPMPLPPLAEQRRIVAKVEALLARVNVARERLAGAPLLLKRIRQSMLAAACSGRLTDQWRVATISESVEQMLLRVPPADAAGGRGATEDVIQGRCILAVGNPDRDAPRGWKWVPLARVARLESGHTPSRKRPEYWGGRVQWIGIQDAREHHGGVISRTRQTITEAGLANSSARILPAGTVCLSRTASVGYVVRMAQPMATSQDFVNWVCSEALDPEFLMFALMAEGEGIKKFGRGTTHTTIYYPEVKALHICLPPLDEQVEIASRCRGILPVVERLEAVVMSAQSQAGRAPQAILRKAFRGELVPTEAELASAEGREFESAEKLLRRVTASANATTSPESDETPRKRARPRKTAAVET